MITDKLKNITHIPNNYLIPNPPPPRSVKIELSSKCNFRCKFCSINDRPYKPKDMSWDLFVKIANELNEIGVEEFGLFLIGEPFINPDLLYKAIKYLKQDLKVPYVFITSNGSLATPDKVKICMDAGLDSLKWSCNYANIDQFNSIANVNSEFFKNMIDNIKEAFYIREYNSYTTKLYASSIHYDNDQIELMKLFIEKNILPFVDEHYWLPLYTMGGNAIDRENELGYKPIAGNSGTYNDPVDPLPCWTLFTEGHIMSDGRLTACCADSNGKWSMGDLNNKSFMEIWHSKEFIELREAHLKLDIKGTKCEKCALF